jgi:radical SAM superfamily enzyme YgiQ (UPF0313 family)
MKKDAPHILLINPWIHDFAAYDFWAKPLGLLTLGGILRKQGYRITYLDCLDRFHPQAKSSHNLGKYGKGHYLKTPIKKPAALTDVSRTYSRYGLPEPLVRKELTHIPKPQAVLVTSLMTYWYPGVFAVIGIVREVMPNVPIILGGVYATLCREHAIKHAGADWVLSGEGETLIVKTLDDITGFTSSMSLDPDNMDTYPKPCHDLQRVIAYVPILTGRGCPYRCTYCASSFLNDKHRRKSPDHVVEEIGYWHQKYGVRDFAFYDDALLVNPESHIMPILEGVIRHEMPIRFHTPNALHIRSLNGGVAQLLFKAGFKTIRLGLETAFFDHRDSLDTKVGPEEFERAVTYLKRAGFTDDSVGAYLLFGLPGQDMKTLEASVKIVKNSGVKPVLAQYSPIPHTALWEDAVASSRYDLAADPIFHNNSIFPCQKAPFSWKTISRLKSLTR